jgi:hypothetical protein
MRIVNVPTRADEDRGGKSFKRVEMSGIVRSDAAVVRSYTGLASYEAPPPGYDPEHNAVDVCAMYIGDHMFERRDQLRGMIAMALADCIRQGRDIGYRQAQADMRRAMGMDK